MRYTTTITVREPNPDWGDKGGFVVNVHADDASLDRTHCAAWSVGPSHRNLAERLKRAVDAGAVLKGGERRTDIHGKTYWSVNQTAVMGRRMNADLKRLGF